MPEARARVDAGRGGGGSRGASDVGGRDRERVVRVVGQTEDGERTAAGAGGGEPARRARCRERRSWVACTVRERNLENSDNLDAANESTPELIAGVKLTTALPNRIDTIATAVGGDGAPENKCRTMHKMNNEENPETEGKSIAQTRR